jgi:hypothetical protein
MMQANALRASAIALLLPAETAPSAARRARARTTVEQRSRQADELDSTLRSEALALGLTKCAHNPYSATHHYNAHGGPFQ